MFQINFLLKVKLKVCGIAYISIKNHKNLYISILSAHAFARAKELASTIFWSRLVVAGMLQKNDIQGMMGSNRKKAQLGCPMTTVKWWWHALDMQGSVLSKNLSEIFLSANVIQACVQLNNLAEFPCCMN